MSEDRILGYYAKFFLSFLFIKDDQMVSILKVKHKLCIQNSTCHKQKSKAISKELQEPHNQEFQKVQ